MPLAVVTLRFRNDLIQQLCGGFHGRTGILEGLHVKLKNNFAIAFFDNFLVIDRSKCKTAAQERTVLAHEAGHYMSGAFYRAYSPFEVKEQAEHRAFAASVEKYLPVNEILNCYKMGMTENWEIAEYFNLEEEFVEKAVHYWTDCKGIDFNCL